MVSVIMISVTKLKGWLNKYYTDELEMVKKISKAKDVEADQQQVKLKASEGEYVCRWR